MIERFLNEQQGGDLLPTRKNVQLLLGLGQSFANRGDPTLIAFDHGTPAGYIEWGAPGAQDAFDLRWRTCHTFGSYVVPACRHKGIAVELREFAELVARGQGYERIIGPVALTNERGIRHFIEQHGAWPTTVQFEYLL